MQLRSRGGLFTLSISAILGATLALPSPTFAQGDDASTDPPSAQMRFLAGNLIGPTDMTLDGEPVAEDLFYGAITDYFAVPAGDHVLATDGFHVAERPVQLKAGANYTAALVPVDQGIEIAIVADKSKPKAGQVQARVVSLCPECAAIDFDAAREKKPLAKKLNYDKGKLAGKYAKVKPGALQLLARERGAGRPLADFEPVFLTPGTSYSLFVVGRDPSRVALVPAVDAAISSARFMNASREPTVVDVYVDGKRVAKRLFPGQASEKPVQLLAGDHLVQVVEAGEKPATGALHADTVTFPTGAVGVEAVAGESVEAVSIPTSKAPKAKVSKVRFAHIDPEIPAVDIDLRGMDPVLGLEVGQWTEYMAVPGNETYVWIRPSDDPMGIYHEFPLPLGPRENVTGYLAGSPDIPTVEVVLVADPTAKKK